jgi:sugar/nucleoside kinase (ribokinase family)
MRSAVVAGHVCVDLSPELPALPLPRPGELVEIGPLAMSPGGCVSNTAGDLAALGADVHVVGDAGDDELGTALVRMLRARGTRIDQLRLLPGRSTSYSVVVQRPGEDRSFWHHVGANTAFDGSEVDFAGAGLLHVGYPSLLPALIASGGEALQALLARARNDGLTTSLDLAVLDPGSAAAEHDWPALLARVLPLVDVLSPSADDVRSTLHLDVGEDPESLRRTARRLVDMGAGIVLLTAGPAGLQLSTSDTARLGGAGAMFAGDEARQAQWSGRDEYMPALDVEVHTTLGAGDAATAGLLFGLLAGLDPLESLGLAAHTAADRVRGAKIERRDVAAGRGP